MPTDERVRSVAQQIQNAEERALIDQHHQGPPGLVVTTLVTGSGEEATDAD